MAKVSIIMPVLNAEKYIDTAFESILCQKLSNIEVICIDAGSSDTSFNILQKYSKQYNNIEVYQMPDMHFGKIMNHAIRRATGKYIAFFDVANGFVDDESLKLMYDEAKSQDADVMCGNLLKISKSGTQGYASRIVKIRYFERKDTLEPAEYGLPYAFHKNIYKKDFLIENNLEFPDIVYYDDPLFMAKILSKVNELHVIDANLYNFKPRIQYKDMQTYKQQYAYTQNFKDTLDTLIDAGFESMVRDYRKEMIEHIKFEDNIEDETLKTIICDVFGDVDKYFKDDDEKYAIDLLLNDDVDEDDEYYSMKKELYDDILNSDELDFDMLHKFIKCEDKYTQDEVQKTSYKLQKQVIKDINNEEDHLRYENMKLDEYIKLQDDIKRQIMDSKNTKAIELLDEKQL